MPEVDDFDDILTPDEVSRVLSAAVDDPLLAIILKLMQYIEDLENDSFNAAVESGLNL